MIINCWDVIVQFISYHLYFRLSKMASKWQDEFDFMDEGEKKQGKKSDPKKGKKNTYGDNDFADLEDDDKGIKLPSINNKQSYQNTEKSKKNLGKIALEEISIKKDSSNSKSYLNQGQEFEEQFEESIAPMTSPLKQKSSEVIKKESQIAEPDEAEPQQEQNYEENYDEDFQVHQEKKPSPLIHKPKQKQPQTSKTEQPAINIPKPAVKSRKGAESVAKKIDNSARVYSRNSARSYDRSSQSRTRVEERKQEAPNKYSALAEKQCPEYNRQALQQFSMDKLTRQNQRIRNAIKKLNDELNDLINKNINQLKTKKVQKQLNQDDLVKQLEEQRNSNETALQNSIRDLAKLKNKEGSLKEEDYHLTLDQNILEAKNSIAQCTKLITKLKFEVDNEGKRLTKIDKIDKQQSTVDISNIKINTINAQKELDKNEDHLKKMEAKYDELTKKLSQIEDKLSKQMDQAREKGISVITNPELFKKAEQLRKKVDVGRNHKGKTEALFKTKADMVSHELEQIRGQIKQIEASNLACHSSCEQVQSEGRKVVEKAKRGGKLSGELTSVLDNILSQMEQGMVSSKENIDDRSTFSHPKGAKKYHSQKNVDKVSVPPPPPPKESEKLPEDTNTKKPQLFKKKKEDEKQDQRIWKHQPTESPKKAEKARESVPDLARFEDREEKIEEKKKPFMIKKSRQRVAQQKVESPKQEIKQTKPQYSKNEEAPSIAPRMIKFKKNKEEPAKDEPKVAQNNDKNYLPNAKQASNDVKIEEKQEEDKPSFVPRRFNLKLKDKKTEDAGYVASTREEKKEETKVEELKPKQQEYKPRRLNAPVTEEKLTQPVKSGSQPEEEKPKLNLRLRDRQKQLNRQQNVEEKISPAKEQMQKSPGKILISLNDNPNPLKQNNNPYAQAQQAPKREREGRIKKQKPIQNVPKQQFNIYQQAQDLTNVKEITTEKPKPALSLPEPQQELDLNKMLGINKSKNQGYQDLLAEKPNDRAKKKEKKETNFFGDLQI